MPTFQYEAVSRSGQTEKGTIEAESNDDAMAKLKGNGFYPTSIRAAKGATGGDKKAAKLGKKKGGGLSNIQIGKIKSKVITNFSRQLSTLQDAGLPILRSIKILEEQERPGPFKNTLREISEDVEGGSSLSESMAKHPKAFDKLYTKMIAAGEVGGVLDIILQRLADYMEKAQALKKRIIGAMVYPAVVLFVAVAIVTGIMIFIIPQFAKIFTDFGVELPWLTKFLISIADWVAGLQEGQMIPGWIVILAAPFVTFFAFKLAYVSEIGRRILDRLRLYIPVFGKLTKYGTTGRMCRTLGTLIAAGVPILEAITITRDTVGNSVFERCMQMVHDSIREGESFADPLRESKVVDLIVVNMVDVGEETGELDKMLMKIADNYDEEVDNMIKTMMSLLEPVMIVFLGGIVLFIVAALFMPLPSLIQGVGG